ncbi:glycosyltransferase [Evansella cellulosilytica]|uniref:Glycosyl transferase group 1 n=1 Tax=Evansella cellulosilytica (strain ATCC 21833 / DSM 2522 / FERM P-1141 / JCM 9156 / N-4) TaxID=649639 RepID=E6TSC2_EVAC2|nr:glycosyltransferase [Evansella cellulosilytica]ADU31891.1 glycosyl transferase group 1 [Evansella cellulosilytica DSM 2522]
MSNTKSVVHLTTVHHPLDPRIYYKECKSLHKAGFKVSLIVPEDHDSKEITDITVVPIKKRKGRLKRMVLSTIEAYRKARALQADYYHIHDPELLPLAWLLKKKSNVVIYDIHEDYETSMQQKEYIPKSIRKLMGKTYRLIERFFSRKLALCLAEKYYKEKYPSGTCILNYPVLNEQLIDHKIDSTMEREDKLIYTGNMTEERGAKIHARLPLIDEQINVSFYGRCPRALAEEMLHLAGEKKDQLHIEGIDRYVPKSIIDQSYVKHQWLAGIALFPPTDHYMKKELTKFFEYMSVGLPIICSNFPMWKQFVEEYSCGIAVDPYNDDEIRSAIEFLRTNRNLALEMGNNGKKAVMEKLNWHAEEKKLINWYKELALTVNDGNIS